MSLHHDEVDNILRIIDASHFSKLTMQVGDLKLTVEKGPRGAALDANAILDADARDAGAAIAADAKPVSLPHPEPKAAVQIASDLVAVRAPMLGTFYRGPAPEAPPFVEVGTEVGPDDTVGLVEIMKLYHSIAAGLKGTVEQILAENATLVEYNEILMTIRPQR